MALKYRVVALEDGTYRCQFRCLFWFWLDSRHPPSGDREAQIAFARPEPRMPRKPRAVGVVWQ